MAIPFEGWNEKKNNSEFGDGPFARSCHMVYNLPCWMASYALGHPKQREVTLGWWKSLCFGGCCILLSSSIDRFADPAPFFVPIVSNSYYGMLTGQLHINLPPEHPIMSFVTIEIKMAAVSVKRSMADFVPCDGIMQKARWL